MNLVLEYEKVKKEDLPSDIQNMIVECKSKLNMAYVPYSGFHVACTLKLDNNILLSGVNVENAAYPACICAERTAISTLRTQYQQAQIESIVVATFNEKIPHSKAIAAPCGECRQVIIETIKDYHHTVPIYLYGSDDEIIYIKDVKTLLPFSFSSDELLGKK